MNLSISSRTSLRFKSCSKKHSITNELKYATVSKFLALFINPLSMLFALHIPSQSTCVSCVSAGHKMIEQRKRLQGRERNFHHKTECRFFYGIRNLYSCCGVSDCSKSSSVWELGSPGADIFIFNFNFNVSIQLFIISLVIITFHTYFLTAYYFIIVY